MRALSVIFKAVVTKTYPGWSVVWHLMGRLVLHCSTQSGVGHDLYCEPCFDRLLPRVECAMASNGKTGATQLYPEWSVLWPLMGTLVQQSYTQSGVCYGL